MEYRKYRDYLKLLKLSVKFIIFIIGIIVIKYEYFSENKTVLEFSINTISEGTMRKKFKNGYSVVVYKRTKNEMKDLKVVTPYIAIDDTKCLIVLKTEGNKKYFRSTRINNDCGVKYDLDGTHYKNKERQLKKIPFTIKDNKLIVEHGFFEWKNITSHSS